MGGNALTRLTEKSPHESWYQLAGTSGSNERVLAKCKSADLLVSSRSHLGTGVYHYY